MFKVLFNAFVRSGLEYASVVWAPYTQNLKDSIESVQKKFLRFLLHKVSKVNTFQAPYDLVKLIFSYDTLGERRDSFCVQQISNLLNYRVDDPLCLVKLNFNVPDLRLRVNVGGRNAVLKPDPGRTTRHLFSPLNGSSVLYNEAQFLEP